MRNFSKQHMFKKNIKETINEIIKNQEELKRSEERYRIVAEATNDIIWEGDLVNNKRFFSGKLYEILGYKAKELENLDEWFNIVHPDDVNFVKEGISQQITEKIAVKTFEYRVKSKCGSYKYLLSSTKCEFNERGEAIKAFGAFTDITELKEQQKRVHNLAYYDSITGLPNRVMLGEMITKRIQNANFKNSKFSMIFIDLDNFKFVNDSYGHFVGDNLLIEVGKRLREIKDDKVISFRLGGDEFIILIENIADKHDVEQFLLFLDKALASPICVDNNVFRIKYSSGTVIYPENGSSFQELLKNADTAMYKSKDIGKGVNSFYHENMGKAAIEKAEIQADLHKALENQEFKLFYQPIVDVATGEINGCEALIRWVHPQKGIISPIKFISIAEENGAILEIGKWVFERACKYARDMHERGNKNFYVSINISPYQLLENEFIGFVIDTIRKIGISPELIIMEITESVLIESLDLAIDKLKDLRNNNIKIALDDFGCGYSSLTYLKRLPINIVKIDKSFIDDIKSREDTKNMTSSIILLAKQLGLSVIAEGVETDQQRNYLKDHACDMFQGYLVSKPIDEVEFINLVNSRII